MVELYELAIHEGQIELEDSLRFILKEKARKNPDLEKLISDGIRLAQTQPINLELMYQ